MQIVEVLGHCTRCHDSFSVDVQALSVRGVRHWRPCPQPVLTYTPASSPSALSAPAAPSSVAPVPGAEDQCAGTRYDRLTHTPRYGCGGAVRLFGALPHE